MGSHSLTIEALNDLPLEVRNESVIQSGIYKHTHIKMQQHTNMCLFKGGEESLVLYNDEYDPYVVIVLSQLRHIVKILKKKKKKRGGKRMKKKKKKKKKKK